MPWVMFVGVCDSMSYLLSDGCMLFMVRVCLDCFGTIFGKVLACCSPIFCLSGVEYWYPNRVLIPKFNTGIWVSVPAREGIGTPGIDTHHQGIDTPLILH
ncbi:hypothetical protein GQ457_05G025550 [Hibiscus cannabinus]